MQEQNLSLILLLVTTSGWYYRLILPKEHILLDGDVNTFEVNCYCINKVNELQQQVEDYSIPYLAVFIDPEVFIIVCDSGDLLLVEYFYNGNSILNLSSC